MRKGVGGFHFWTGIRYILVDLWQFFVDFFLLNTALRQKGSWGLGVDSTKEYNLVD
jgi:hypothetical protein